MPELNYGTFASRALRLRCPRCGQGTLFKNLFVMHRHCPQCQLKYERAPGYFLGSTYVNFGFTALTVTSLYMWFHFGMGYSNEILTVPLVAYCVVIPLLFFRYARAWWLAMDCYCDPMGFGLNTYDPNRSNQGDPSEQP